MKKWNAGSVALLLTVCISIPAWAQKDPGPRPGAASAGGPYPTLNANEQAFFSQAFLRFQEVDSVAGASTGLGPTFNGNSCTMCHSQPAIGGSSPGLAEPAKSGSESASSAGWSCGSDQPCSRVHHRERAGA